MARDLTVWKGQSTGVTVWNGNEMGIPLAEWKDCVAHCTDSRPFPPVDYLIKMNMHTYAHTGKPINRTPNISLESNGRVQLSLQPREDPDLVLRRSTLIRTACRAGCPQRLWTGGTVAETR